MKFCPQCYKEISGYGIHTCSLRYSSCCGNGIIIVCGIKKFDPQFDSEFKIQRDKTYYYQCKKCGDACDLTYEYNADKDCVMDILENER